MRARSLTTALTVLSAAAAVSVAVPAALASPPPGHGKPTTTHTHHSTAGHGKVKTQAQLTGRIASVGESQFVLHTKGGHRPFHGKDITVFTTDKTLIRYHGHPITLAQVPVGARVTTRVALFSDGTVFAKWVNVNGATKLVPLPSASPSAPASASASTSASASASASESASTSASPSASESVSPSSSPSP